MAGIVFMPSSRFKEKSDQNTDGFCLSPSIEIYEMLLYVPWLWVYWSKSPPISCHCQTYTTKCEWVGLLVNFYIENHGSIRVGKDLQDRVLDWTPQCQLDHSTKCHVQMFLDHFQGWSVPHFPGQFPYQHLTTFSEKKFFLMSDMNLPWCSFRPFLLILSLVAWEKRPTPGHNILSGSCREQ